MVAIAGAARILAVVDAGIQLWQEAALISDVLVASIFRLLSKWQQELEL